MVKEINSFSYLTCSSLCRLPYYKSLNTRTQPMLMTSLTNQVTINSRHFETVTVITSTVTKSFGKNGNRDEQESQHITFTSHLPCNCQQRSDEITLALRNYSIKNKIKRKNTIVMKWPPKMNKFLSKKGWWWSFLSSPTAIFTKTTFDDSEVYY